jgi:hypothetical protein
MISKLTPLALALFLHSWVVAASETEETRMETQSSAILPPLPDLPIPGSHSKVSGNKEIQAVTRRNPEVETEKKTITTAIEPPAEPPSPLVFGNGDTGKIVF